MNTIRSIPRLICSPTLSPEHLRRNLVALYLPRLRNPGSILRNLAQRRYDLAHGGTVQMTRNGPAVYNHAAADFGGSVLPLSDNARNFTIFAEIIRTNSGEAGILQQYVAADPARMSLQVGGSNHVRYSHPGDVVSAHTSAVGDRLTIAVVEQFSGFIRLYVNGVQSAASGTSLGYCSSANTTLEATRDLQLLSLAIWSGSALLPLQVFALHADPTLLVRISQTIAGSPVQPLPSLRELQHGYNHDMPLRAWYRRHKQRQAGY